MSTTTLESQVRNEMGHFRQAVPELIKQGLEGRWAVFHDGGLHASFASETDAYREALDAFGPDGGFVVACVQEAQPTPLTVGVLFGLL